VEAVVEVVGVVDVEAVEAVEAPEEIEVVEVPEPADVLQAAPVRARATTAGPSSPLARPCRLVVTCMTALSVERPRMP
jgi:hypothetical protein